MSGKLNRTKLKSLYAVFLITTFLVSCASQIEQNNAGLDSPTGTAQSTTTAPTADYKYVIGPGDTLDIFVWGYKDLSLTVPVRPDGKITTRLVEDMLANGKTPTQLARELEIRYQVYVKNPTVTVTVNKFIGVPSQQIKVVGGGANPRTVPYVNGMTVLDVMIEIGGLKKFSSGNKAVLVRTVNGARESYRVRLHDLLNKGDIGANRDMNPGDILIIPESWF
jgi:polysaccharide export outer membrane protein